MIPQLVPPLGGGPDAYLDFDFRFGQERYWLNRQRYGEFGLVPGATSTGGAGFGQALRNGAWSGNLPNGTPLIGDGGLGVWEARTNSIPNPVMTGAVVGNPGTIPTGWINLSPHNGLSREVVGLGTENGLPYIDLRISGTFTSTFYNVQLQPQTGVAVTNGQVITPRIFAALKAGTSPPLLALNTSMRTSGGSFLGTASSATNLNTINNTLLPYGIQCTANNASVASVDLAVTISGTIGQVVDFTIRIAAPNLKLGPNINDPPILQTSGLAATRTAVAQSVGGLVLPPAGAIYEEYIQPIIQTTTRTYVWNILDGGNTRFTRRASFGSGSSNTDFVTGDGSGITTTLSRSAPAAGTLVRSLCAYDTTTARAAFALNGTDTFESRRSTAATLTNATLQIGQGGAGGQINSVLRRLVILPRFPDAAERIAITTGGY